MTNSCAARQFTGASLPVTMLNCHRSKPKSQPLKNKAKRRSSAMGFIMDGLEAEAYDREYSDKQLVQRIIQYFKPQMRRIMLVAVVVLLTALVDTGLPIVISRGIDQLQK